MWHHKFDPHGVPAVPMAELSQKAPTKHHQRSESVKDFLNRSKLIPDPVVSAPILIQPMTNKRSPSVAVGPIDSKIVAMSK
jgi:hypothetical protein